MKIREEKFNSSDILVIERIYSKHLRSFWRIQFMMILMSIVGPCVPSKGKRGFPETIGEYQWEVALVALFLTGLWIYYFYYSKWALLQDRKKRIKEILEYEVIRKERLFQNNTFYVFLEDHVKEEVSKELYEKLQSGNKVRYEQAKHSKERLSEIRKQE